MGKLEIYIDGGILTEAEKVLHSLGMDVEMAVSIYLRRIALEKGLPMAMTGSASNLKEPQRTEEFSEDDSRAYARGNGRITTTMVDEVWQAFLRHVRGFGEINQLSTEVSTKTGMNRGSAFIYLTILANLVNGDPNTRVLKFTDLEYLMGKIQIELGEGKYQNALNSLMASVPYWREKIPGVFADKVEAYCKKHFNR